MKICQFTPAMPGWTLVAAGEEPPGVRIFSIAGWALCERDGRQEVVPLVIDGAQLRPSTCIDRVLGICQPGMELRALLASLRQSQDENR